MLQKFAKSLQSCPAICDPMDHSLPGSSVHGDFPGKNTGVGCHALFQVGCHALCFCAPDTQVQRVWLSGKLPPGAPTGVPRAPPAGLVALQCLPGERTDFCCLMHFTWPSKTAPLMFHGRLWGQARRNRAGFQEARASGTHNLPRKDQERTWESLSRTSDPQSPYSEIQPAVSI